MQEIIKKYTEIAKEMNWISWLVLVFMLSFPRNIENPCWTVWLILWAIEFRWLHPSHFQWKKTILPACLMAMYVVWEFVSATWAGNPQQALSAGQTQCTMILLLLPLLFGVNEHYDMRTTLRVLVAGAVSSSLVYTMIMYWVQNADAIYNYAIDAKPEPLRWDLFTLFLCGLKHRFYHSAVLIMAILASGYLYLTSKDWHEKIAMVLAFVVVSGMLLAVGSRILLPILCLLLLIIVVHKPKLFGWWMYGLGAVLLVGASVYLMKYQPRLPASAWANESRILIYQTIWDVRNQIPIAGMGAGNSTDFLIQQWIDRGFDTYEFVERRLGTHSQYLRTWMELGPIGLVAFVIAWCCGPLCFPKQKRVWMVLMTVFWMMSMLTDDVLSRVEGVILYGVMMIMVVNMTDKEDTLKETNNTI